MGFIESGRPERSTASLLGRRCDRASFTNRFGLTRRFDVVPGERDVNRADPTSPASNLKKMENLDQNQNVIHAKLLIQQNGPDDRRTLETTTLAVTAYGG